MTALMGSTAKAKVAIMSSAIEGLKIEMGALIYEGVSPIISKITEWAKAFQELSKDTQKTILKIAGIAAVIGPLLMILALMATAVSAVSTSLKGMWKALVYAAKGVKTLTLAIAKNPLGALAVIVSSLAGYWLLTAKNNKTANAVLDETSIKAKNAAERLAEVNKELDLQGKSQRDLLKIEAKSNQARILEELSGLTFLATERRAELNKEYDKWGDVLNRVDNPEVNQVNNLSNLAEGLSNVKTEAQLAMDAIENYSGITITEAPSAEPKLRGGRPEDPSGGGRVLSGLEKELESGSTKVTEFFDKWGDSINMVGDIFGNMMEGQMTDLENSHKKKADAIANSNMNEEDKATAMLKLDKETAKEKAKILRKQAIAEKAAAVISSIMNGALAISKTLGETGFLGIPLAAIVGGLAAVQTATIAASPIPAFAQGGLVTGATMGLVGEGRGTTMSNPEVIAPLDKLKGMLGDSGQQSYIPNVTISGDDLLIVFDRATRRKERR